MALSVPAVVAQLYLPPVDGVPLLAACVVVVTPADQAPTALPVGDIRQLAGSVAVPEVPIELKFCVTIVVSGKEVWLNKEKGNKMIIVTSKTFAMEKP